MKPASQESDNRMVGAIIGLRVAAARDFRDAAALWCGQLMQRGHLFLEVFSGKTVLSLGFHSFGGLCWEAEQLGDSEFYQLTKPNVPGPECPTRLQAFCPTVLSVPGQADNLETYAGIPTEVCFVLSVSNICQRAGALSTHLLNPNCLLPSEVTLRSYQKTYAIMELCSAVLARICLSSSTGSNMEL